MEEKLSKATATPIGKLRQLFQAWTPVKSLVFVLLLVIYGVILLHKIEVPRGDDLPRLVKNGEMVFHDPNILTKNVYSYAEPEQPFANHHWLSSVIFFGLHEVIGFGGLVIFKTLLLLLAFSLLFFLALKRADFWLVALFSLPTIWILGSRIQVRPEIFSYLLITIFLWLLFDVEEHPKAKRVYWLIPLQILWVNLHLFFGIGVLMTWGFLLEKLVQQPRGWRTNPLIKKLLAVSLLLPLACLVNPYGLGGAVFSLVLNVGKDFPLGIAENQSLFPVLRQAIVAGNPFILLLVVSVLIFALSFLLTWKQRPVFFALGFLGTVVLGAWMVRAVPFFVFMFLPGVTSNFQGLYIKILDWVRLRSVIAQKIIQYSSLGIFIGALVLLICLRFASVTYAKSHLGIGLSRHFEDTGKFLVENNIRGPIFNDTDIGSYLIYYLYPQEKVFTDNRFGDAYSAEFIRTKYLPAFTSEADWEQISQEYGFNTIVLTANVELGGLRSFVLHRVHDPKWSLVHADPYAFVFVRVSPENQGIIDTYGITNDNVAQRLEPLTQSRHKEDLMTAIDIFNLFDRAELATATSLQVVNLWPKTGYMWFMLGMRALNDPESSPMLPVMYLERAVSLGQKSSTVYAFLSSAYLRVGFQERANWAAQRALNLSNRKAEISQIANELENLRLPVSENISVPDLQSHEY